MALKLAFPYEGKLNVAWQSVVFNEKYQFYVGTSMWDYTIKIDDSSWNKIQMVSVDADDNVIGYLTAHLDRYSNKVSGVGAINFTDINLTFSRDFNQFLCELFTKHKYRKIEWFVIVGNPAEKMYDQIVSKYGGRIVGTRYGATITADGVLRDEKEYEIFKEDYEVFCKGVEQ